MNRATSSVSGRVAIVSGSAICWMRASFMTTIRSAIESASSWLCVTWMNISPSWRWRFLSSTRIRSCRSRSRSPSGSSSSSAFGLRDEHPRERDALLLPAGELAGLAVGERVEADHLERLHRLPAALVLPDAVHLQPELDVLEHRSVRKQREVLEDRRRGPLVRRQRDERLAVEQDVAARRELVAADHPERRRLAAPGRAEQHDVLAVVDVQVEVVHGERSAGEHLRDVDEVEARASSAEGAAGAAPSEVNRAPSSAMR